MSKRGIADACKNLFLKIGVFEGELPSIQECLKPLDPRRPILNQTGRQWAVKPGAGQNADDPLRAGFNASCIPNKRARLNLPDPTPQLVDAVAEKVCARLAEDKLPHPEHPAWQSISENQLYDGIHHCLDGERPRGTDETSVNVMRAAIASQLRFKDGPPGFRLVPKGSGKVRVKENGLCDVVMSNGQVLSRTKEEVELDLLIHGYLKKSEALQTDAGHAGCDPSPAGAVPPQAGSPDASSGQAARPVSDATLPRNDPASVPAPTHAASASATENRPPEVSAASQGDQRMRNCRQHYFDRHAIDLKMIDRQILAGGSHEIVKISALGHNCWWRSGILSALFQLKPNMLRSLLTERLGDQFPRFAADVDKLCEMGAAARLGQLDQILTAKECDDTNAMPTAGRLKQPGLSDAEDNGAGERSCKRIVRQLLVAAGQPAEVVDAAIDNTDAINGDNRLMQILLRQLNCTYAAVNRLPSKIGDAPDAQFTHGIELHANLDSRLLDIPVASDGRTDVGQVVSVLASEGVPWIVFGADHVNLAIPKDLLTPNWNADRQPARTA